MSTLSATIGRGTTASRPSAGQAGRIYYCTDSTVGWFRDNGSSWDSAEPSSLTNPMSHEGALIYGGSAGTPTELVVGAAAQALVSNGTDPVWTDVLPWHIQLIPMIATPDATVGTWALAGNGDVNAVFPFYSPGSTANSGQVVGVSNSSGPAAQNDAWRIDVVLAKGTWDFHCWVRKSTNTGIITLNQDGSSMGTADTYAASAAAAEVSVTGWSVSTTGKHQMQLLMATKNASSSGYNLTFYGIEFRRTA